MFSPPPAKAGAGKTKRSGISSANPRIQQNGGALAIIKTPLRHIIGLKQEKKDDAHKTNCFNRCK